MIRRFFVAAVVVALSAVAQQPNCSVKLYPQGVEQSNGLEGRLERLAGGRVASVSDPWMEVYLAPNPNGKMVVICPGGGYVRLAAEHEGSMFAQWLAGQGISAAVLYYRMPNGHTELPRQDVLRAIEIVRTRAAEWHVSPNKVGVMGFSAGGHLAATALTKYTAEQNRPDFGVLFYPVISMDEAITHRGSRESLLGVEPSAEQVEQWSLEREVDADTPPCFVALSADDKSVPVANSLRFVEALGASRKAHDELHLYPTGGHGWGFNGEKFEPYRHNLMESLARWLGEQ